MTTSNKKVVIRFESGLVDTASVLNLGGTSTTADNTTLSDPAKDIAGNFAPKQLLLED